MTAPSPNFGNYIHEVDKKVVDEANIPLDPFPKLLKEDGFASVSCTVGKARAYGEEKISFHVSIKCDQNQATIDEAGKLAFMKAAEFCEDAMTALGWSK